MGYSTVKIEGQFANVVQKAFEVLAQGYEAVCASQVKYLESASWANDVAFYEVSTDHPKGTVYFFTLNNGDFVELHERSAYAQN